MIPYQHCTVSGKIIAGPAWFYVYSVMLMQQSRRVSFMVTTSWRSPELAGRQTQGRRRDRRSDHYASCQICMTNTFLFRDLYVWSINPQARIKLPVDSGYLKTPAPPAHHRAWCN